MGISSQAIYELDIIDNTELRSLFAYGAKYRLPKRLSWSLVKKEINKSLQHHITSMIAKYKLKASDFNNWRERVIEIVNNRIYRCKKFQNRDTHTGCNKSPCRFCSEIFSDFLYL